jgi:hypothetical protein
MALELTVLGESMKGLDLSTKGLAELYRRLKESPNVLEIPVTHRFTPHLYIREVCVPAGSGVLTYQHKTEHPFVVSKGKILVWTKEQGAVLIQAPFTGITKPGTCRLAVALEDTVWTTFHATDETDIPTLERWLGYTPEEAALLEEKEQKCLS